jgi:hypothetical protein
MPAGHVDSVRFTTLESSNDALGGKAIRKQVRISLTADDSVGFEMLIYTPSQVENAPVFVGLNFKGNHTVHADPAFSLGGSWVRDDNSGQDQWKSAEEDSRGTSASRWPVEMILERGYAVVTAHYGQIAPDDAALAFAHGVPTLFQTPDEKDRSAHDWGTIGAWSWGLARMLDYLEKDPRIDASNAAVIGHSRLGKTALWAGATNPRFALVISNDSGCGGAALFRRRFGERIDHMAKNFPHWFCRTYSEYANREPELPVDQHMLIAAIAPRPVYVASATEDRWADPKGEFLAAKGAEPVYQLYGKAGLPADSWPDPDQPAQGTIGYHLRTGKHDVTAYDWQQYLDFADRHFKN